MWLRFNSSVETIFLKNTGMDEPTKAGIGFLLLHNQKFLHRGSPVGRKHNPGTEHLGIPEINELGSLLRADSANRLLHRR